MADTPVSPDSPLMKAWEAYKATDEYANTAYWALQSQHTQGSLWAAFVRGYEAAIKSMEGGANG
jgi:hypothetical protein